MKTTRNNEPVRANQKGAKMERKRTKVVASTVQKSRSTTKQGQISIIGQKVNNSASRRSSLRSTKSPELLYDFIDDSPKLSNTVKQGNAKKNGTKAKGTAAKNGSSNKKKAKVTSEKQVTEPLVTPKPRKEKAKCSAGIVENTKKNNVKKKVKPLPPPNFDISPIPLNVSKRSSKKAGRLGTPGGSGNTRSTRSSNNSNMSLNTPTVSIIEPEKTFEDDSAIFMSPRKNLKRICTEKTSTPAISQTAKKSKKEKDTKKSKQLKEKNNKNTSTPCEVKPTKAFTRLKTVDSECSPVQRVDTPTSDYASMDSLTEPSPSPVKQAKRKREKSPTPAFSLENEYDPEPLSLNRSINVNYSNKKTKKKVKTSRYSVDKVEEWASRVNSELEDIENFELSIED